MSTGGELLRPGQHRCAHTSGRRSGRGVALRVQQPVGLHPGLQVIARRWPRLEASPVALAAVTRPQLLLTDSALSLA